MEVNSLVPDARCSQSSWVCGFSGSLGVEERRGERRGKKRATFAKYFVVVAAACPVGDLDFANSS